MRTRIIAAAASSLLLVFAGLGSASVLAGQQHAAWPCSERPWEKHCKPASTSTVTLPAATIVVTQPAAPPVTVTLPAPPAVTVTLPAPPAQTVTVTTAAKPKAKKPAKKKPARTGNKPRRKHAKTIPPVLVHHGGGVAG